MSSIDRFLIKLNSQISQYVLPSTIKKVITLLVLALSVYYAYDRINRNRRRLAQNRTTATTTPATQRPSHSTAAAALRSSISASNSTLTTTFTSSSSSSSSSSTASYSPVDRLLNSLTATPSLSATQLKDTLPLSPKDKYLTTPSTPPRLVLISTSGIVLTSSSSSSLSTGSVALLQAVVPVLLQLARCCQLVLVTQLGVDEGAGEEREREVRPVLKDCGLMEAGLKEHVSGDDRHSSASIRMRPVAGAVDSLTVVLCVFLCVFAANPVLLHHQGQGGHHSPPATRSRCRQSAKHHHAQHRSSLLHATAAHHGAISHRCSVCNAV